MKIEPYLALWAAVMVAAIRDARTYLKRNKLRSLPTGVEIIDDEGSAVRWIVSDSTRVGGFVWVCSILDHDPERVRSRITLARPAPKNIMRTVDDF